MNNNSDMGGGTKSTAEFLNSAHELALDLESIYGSSFSLAQNDDDSFDYDHFANLYHKVLQPSLQKASLDSGGQDEDSEQGPERHDANVRYLKLLASLSLETLRAEPRILENELVQLSSQLSGLLLGETQPTMHGASSSSRSRASKCGEASSGSPSVPMFSILYTAHESISHQLDQLESRVTADMCDRIPELERSFGNLVKMMQETDMKRELIQRVVEKSDVITGVLELPHIITATTSSQRYRESVFAIKHIRQALDQLLSSGVEETIKGQSGDDDEVRIWRPCARSKRWVDGIIRAVQRQMWGEFERLVVALCRELVVMPKSSRIVGVGLATGHRLGSRPRDGSNTKQQEAEKLVERLQLLKSTDTFRQEELAMLFLLAQWQAWQQWSLPHANDQEDGGNNGNDEDISAENTKQAPQQFRSYLEGFVSWMETVHMVFSKVFGTANEGANAKMLRWLASHACRAATRCLRNKAESADGVVALVQMWGHAQTHTRDLATMGAEFLTPEVIPFIEERLVCHVLGRITGPLADMRGVIADARQMMAEAAAESSKPRGARTLSIAGKTPTGPFTALIERHLALPTRPMLVMQYPLKDTATADDATTISTRVSPVSLMQYPVLSDIHRAFRDTLHELQLIRKTAIEGYLPVTLGPHGIGLTLDQAVALVVALSLDSYLAGIADDLQGLAALAADISSVELDMRAVIGEVCAAFAFGLVRYISESLEEGSFDVIDNARRVYPSIARAARIDLDGIIRQLFKYFPRIASATAIAGTGDGASGE